MSRVIDKSAQKRVLEKYPNAFVHDDGEWVWIRLRETEKVTCEECHRPYERNKGESLCRSLSSGGSEEVAWTRAAETL